LNSKNAITYIDEMHYVDSDNRVIFTSHYHLKRGRCCKSACLHCPYGHVYKLFDFKFTLVDSLESEDFLSVLDDNQLLEKKTVSENLLGAAFGKSIKKINVSELKRENWYYIYLKGYYVGLMEVVENSIRRFYLRRAFRDQNIDIALLTQSWIKEES
jgi:hypothetical protein